MENINACKNGPKAKLPNINNHKKIKEKERREKERVPKTEKHNRERQNRSLNINTKDSEETHESDHNSNGSNHFF